MRRKNRDIYGGATLKREDATHVVCIHGEGNPRSTTRRSPTTMRTQVPMSFLGADRSRSFDFVPRNRAQGAASGVTSERQRKRGSGTARTTVDDSRIAPHITSPGVGSAAQQVFAGLSVTEGTTLLCICGRQNPINFCISRNRRHDTSKRL